MNHNPLPQMDGLVYWTDFYLNLVLAKFSKKNDITNSMLFITLCLFLNLLSLSFFIRWITGFDILCFFPLMSRASGYSWLIALGIISISEILLYFLYFSPKKLRSIRDKYLHINRNRKRIQQFLFVTYCIATWTFIPLIVFF